MVGAKTCQACGHVAPDGELPPSVGPWEIRTPTVTYSGLFCGCALTRRVSELLPLMDHKTGGAAPGADKLDYSVREG